MIDRSDAIAWSLLNPTPQCFYHRPTRSHIVYWKGVAMPRIYAMMIVQEKWLASYSTPEMKERAFKDFKRIYHTGGFGKVDWQVRHLNPQDYRMRLGK